MQSSFGIFHTWINSIARGANLSIENTIDHAHCIGLIVECDTDNADWKIILNKPNY